jgi:amino-acid N-acetyltransferase
MDFSEKEFYLAEFRGRTIGFAFGAASSGELNALRAVLDEFARHEIRAVLLSDDADLLEELAPKAVVSSDERLWAGQLWRRLTARPVAAIALPTADDLASQSGAISRRLGFLKLVWVHASGGLRRLDGTRRSFVDLSELETVMCDAAVDDEAKALLAEIRAMLAAGLPAVNLCNFEGLAEELFTYAGSGTLFTRERYTDVRALALDEFWAAHALVVRGVEEGYLVERSSEELDWVLANAFGVYVEGRHLAGIGALLPSEQGDVGEIASLYTLTRFVGEGVGDHLIRFAKDEARTRGYRYVYACTTSDRVERFFVRHGFAVAEQSAIPAEKWRDYSAERRARVRCLRFEI